MDELKSCTLLLALQAYEDVAGLQVATSVTVYPCGVLCSYYERAVAVVREAGMLSDVAIILPSSRSGVSRAGR